MISTSQKSFFSYKVCVPGFTFFEIVLNQHWRRRRESHKISWNPRIIWRYHLERASFPHLPYRLQRRQTRKYNDNYLVNSTALYDFHDRGFLSIRTSSERFNDRLLFSTH